MKKLTPRGLILSIVFVFALSNGAVAQQPPVRGTTLREALLQAQEFYHLPAIAGIVVSSDRILDIDAVGVGRLGRADAVLQSDRFHLGSLTKAVTATLLAVLVEDGRLQWQSTVDSIFPELAATLDEDYRGITLEQLLRHRAGLPTFTDLGEFDALPTWPGSPTERRAAFTAYLLSRHPASKVGDYSYSNAGYAVAAAMAERVTGKRWEDLVVGRLLEPLGMKAGLGWPAAEAPEQPWGHWLVDGHLAPHDPNAGYRLPNLIQPAGDLNASLPDYALFLQLHLRGLQGQESFLSADTFAHVHQSIDGYALGWEVIDTDGTPVSLHFGSAGTFYAIAAIVPELDLGVFVVTNAGHPAARDAVEWTANVAAKIWAARETR